MVALTEKYGSGTIAVLNAAVTMPCANDSTVGALVTGTWAATLAFEGTVDDTTWFSIPGVTPFGASSVSETINGAYFMNCAGMSQVRIRASAYTSGTATIVWNSDAGTANYSQNVDVSPTMEYGTYDIINNGTSSGNITVGTSSILASVSGTNFANRKVLEVYNNGTVIVWYGATSGVTAMTGLPIFPGTGKVFAFGPSSGNVYLISGTTGQDIRVFEGA